MKALVRGKRASFGAVGAPSSPSPIYRGDSDVPTVGGGTVWLSPELLLSLQARMKGPSSRC